LPRHDNWPSSQFRILALLDGRIERIHVDVHNLSKSLTSRHRGLFRRQAAPPTRRRSPADIVAYSPVLRSRFDASEPRKLSASRTRQARTIIIATAMIGMSKSAVCAVGP